MLREKKERSNQGSQDVLNVLNGSVADGLQALLCRIKMASEQGQLDRSIELLSNAARVVRETTDLTSDDVFLWEQFGTYLILTGEFDELLDLLPKMVELHPWTHDIHSHMLLNLHHLPGIDPNVLYEEHKRWAKIHAPVDRMQVLHDNNAAPDRRLRVGYISPDFRLHPVAFFIEPLLSAHDRHDIEVYAYANVHKPSSTTEYLKNKCDQYRDIVGVDCQSLVDLIKADKIDILVDLAGHTNNNSLSALAYKPAPIQISYLGYPGTTGMEQIDYRMVDSCVNTPTSEQFYVEELVYLPEPFACGSFADSGLPVSSLPVEQRGTITFGAFKNNCKINSQVLSLWAKILKANEDSRLVLRFERGGEASVKDHYLRQFEFLGVSRDRIEISGWMTYLEHMRQYEKVDIGLDTFPFNGHKTTCDALWMGVPVISLVGDSFASRLGLDLLKSVGLEFFAAETESEYLAKATALAQNHQSLAKIRYSMRERISASGLCDSKTFVLGVEKAYRRMWYRWCKEAPKA